MTTTRYAALLRGINVGGHRRLPMAEFRTLLEDLGCQNVATYLQSGQAVFTAPTGDDDALAATISQKLEARYGADIDVIVRDGAYLSAVVGGCPFLVDETASKQLHVAYASFSLDPTRFEQIELDAFAPEQFRLGDRLIYMSLPGGIGRSKLAARLVNQRVIGPDCSVTVRNWNTVMKLAELTRSE